MALSNELSYIAAITFISVLIIDFIVIETVLQLGVFTYGNAIFRIMLILTLELHAVAFFIMNMYPEIALEALTAGAFCYLAWNPLYYYMLIEQNAYWMKDRVKKGVYIGLLLFSAFIFIMSVFTILAGSSIITLAYLPMVHFLELAAMLFLAVTELYLNYQIYKVSKKIVYNVSEKFWKKLKYLIYIFTMYFNGYINCHI
ncbi:hypothetical protein CONCODRAFT_8473 [Conidiobolus coronatus NRRL 28638]|uniref:Uncharacterized protein n=1 Tax=Conidiobolus coronatus (strain ATCC 28846 / CBS 209.66 / NRRL 28638) TaxID=796925 RepID=A0A137P260_CONC2|nr:hypothetical protein CONCODRAFT_8473 [Conidiobolus coronatus NRRL 28638]|eukprot:KXN69135.1 hypothetical protein CONCODRAFT_8473 [Conidiobolus coronatus NRRL 28638]